MGTKKQPSLCKDVENFLGNFDVSQKTLRSYRSGLRKFIEYQIPIGTGALQQFHARMLHDSASYAPRTRNLYLTALKSFLSWMDANDKLPRGYSVAKADAQLKVSRGRRPKPYRHKIADRGMPRLLKHFCVESGMTPQERMETLRNNAMIHVLFSTALRVRELAGLTRAQVFDGAATEININGKGEKDRIVMLSADARKTIRDYLQARTDSSPLLFISHHFAADKPRPLNVTTIWRIVKSAANALQLSSNTSPHMIRHYVATDMLNSGVPLEVVQDYLGHANIETTRTVYAHTHTTTLKARIYQYWHSKPNAETAPEPAPRPFA